MSVTRFAALIPDFYEGIIVEKKNLLLNTLNMSGVEQRESVCNCYYFFLPVLGSTVEIEI